MNPELMKQVYSLITPPCLIKSKDVWIKLVNKENITGGSTILYSSEFGFVRRSALPRVLRDLGGRYKKGGKWYFEKYVVEGEPCATCGLDNHKTEEHEDTCYLCPDKTICPGCKAGSAIICDKCRNLICFECLVGVTEYSKEEERLATDFYYCKLCLEHEKHRFVLCKHGSQFSSDSWFTDERALNVHIVQDH
jgi:hypothetical protein